MMVAGQKSDRMRWALALSIVLWVGCTRFAEGTVDDESDAGDSSGGSSSGSSSGLAPADDAGGSSSSGELEDAASDGASSGLNVDDEKFLAAHNAERANAPGAEPPLAPVTWDSAAAAALRGWGADESCVLDAPPSPGSSNINYGWVHEEIPLDDFLSSQIANGKSHYDREANTCDTQAAVCYVYTNMVQRSVTRIACVFGAKVCPASAGQHGQSKDWRKWACLYVPLTDAATRPY